MSLALVNPNIFKLCKSWRILFLCHNTVTHDQQCVSSPHLNTTTTIMQLQTDILSVFYVAVVLIILDIVEGAPQLMFSHTLATTADMDNDGEYQTSEDNSINHQMKVNGSENDDAELSTMLPTHLSRSQIVFDNEDEEQEDHETGSDKVNFNGNKKEKVFSFQDPVDTFHLIKMTSSEINQIFNKAGFSRNKNRTLTKSDRKKARECRRKNKLFFRHDKKCYHPFARGPCKTTKWIVAHRHKSRAGEGVCRPRLCPEDQVSFNSSCVSLTDPDICPPTQQLTLTDGGHAVCDCLDGSYSRAANDETCYRNFLQGPCNESQAWNNGMCQESSCEPGQILWSDDLCYTLHQDSDRDECLKSDNSELVFKVREQGNFSCLKSTDFLPR